MIFAIALNTKKDTKELLAAHDQPNHGMLVIT